MRIITCLIPVILLPKKRRISIAVVHVGFSMVYCRGLNFCPGHTWAASSNNLNSNSLIKGTYWTVEDSFLADCYYLMNHKAFYDSANVVYNSHTNLYSFITTQRLALCPLPIKHSVES